MKAKLIGANNPTPEEAEKGWYWINCPGCETKHAIAVVTPLSNGARWGFNYDLERPTFTPSLLIRTGKYVPGVVIPEGEYKEWYDKNSTICHSFIRNGMIEFLGDSTHHLSGKTVELPNIE